MMEQDWVPWDNPKEWVLWLVALIIATFFIHNFMEYTKKRTNA